MTIFRLIDFATPSPAISTPWAASASSVLTLCYVGGLYVSTATRIGKARSKDGVFLTKDDETVVRSRLRVASSVALASLLVTATTIKQTAFAREPTLFGALAALRLVGVPLPAPSFLHSNGLPFQPSVTLYTLHHVVPSALASLLLTSTLFAGPLYVCALDETLVGQRQTPSLFAAVRQRLGNVWGLRNYIVGPLTEEIVFRGCIVSMHALAGLPKSALVLVTPLYFGLAHLHHAYEGFVNGGRTRQAFKRASVVSLIQLAYTSVFGWYANFLFMRTNSLLAPTVAHVFCNLMGLPNPVEAAQRHPKRTWPIYASHVFGIVAFASALFLLTKPGLFGGSWFWTS